MQAEIAIYPNAPRRPSGKWDAFEFDIEELRYNFPAEAERFIRAADKCKRDRDFGLRIEREPTKPRDPAAIKIYGWWTSKGWLSPSKSEVPIGYVPWSIASQIDPDVPIFLEIESLYLGRKDEGELWPNVKAFLVMPQWKSDFWKGRRMPTF